MTNPKNAVNFVSDTAYEGPSCTCCGAVMVVQFKCLSCGHTPELSEVKEVMPNECGTNPDRRSAVTGDRASVKTRESEKARDFNWQLQRFQRPPDDASREEIIDALRIWTARAKAAEARLCAIIAMLVGGK